MRSNRLLSFVAFAAVACASSLAPRDANAAFIEAGVQAGVMGRELAGVDYKPGFNLQFHADVALLPPILMIGAYVNGFPPGTGRLKPDAPNAADARGIDFRAIGARAKLRIPIPGPITPYGIAGVGWVHANFPDQTLTVCVPGAPAGTPCAQRRVPDASADFVEFVLGAGALIEIAGPLHFTIEGAWRPTTGYKNDDYEKAVQSGAASGQANVPSPSRNGYAWSVHGGLALSF